MEVSVRFHYPNPSPPGSVPSLPTQQEVAWAPTGRRTTIPVHLLMSRTFPRCILSHSFRSSYNKQSSWYSFSHHLLCNSRQCILFHVSCFTIVAVLLQTPLLPYFSIEYQRNLFTHVCIQMVLLSFFTVLSYIFLHSSALIFFELLSLSIYVLSFFMKPRFICCMLFPRHISWYLRQS